MNITEFFQNILPLLLSGITFLLLGALWYSPIFFGNIWKKEVNLKSSKKDIKMPLTGSFILSLVMANILGYLIKILSLTEILDAVMLSFILWLGFIATSLGISLLYRGNSIKLFLIDGGYQLVVLVSFAVILMLS